MAGVVSGRLIGGRYRIVERLGAGGFGRVWRARDEMLHVDVAVKEVWLPPAMSQAEQDERLVRAEREARNAARLRDHPNIVAVHDVVIDDGVPWTVMQLVHGTSLAEHGPLPVERTTEVARGLLSALRAAHAAGIVHRDIKPANVLLAEDGSVLLTDFGIAVHQADTALTATGAVIGSMEYLAPERARGSDGQPASDLFSLGVTLYQAVQGVSPFRRDTPTGSLTAVLFEDAPPPTRAGPLTPLITGLLVKDPAGRPSVEQALAMLEPRTVRRPAPTVAIHRAAPPADPSRTRHAALAVAIIAVLVTAILLVRATIDDPPADSASRPTGSPTSTISESVTPTTTTATTTTTTTTVQGLPNPCDVVPRATLSAMELTQGGSHPDDNDKRRRCDWWTERMDLPYHFGVVAIYASPYQKDPTGHPVQLAGGVTAHEFVRPPSADLHFSVCLVEWPTSAGFGMVSTSNTSTTSDTSGLCAAARQLANAVLPVIAP